MLKAQGLSNIHTIIITLVLYLHKKKDPKKCISAEKKNIYVLLSLCLFFCRASQKSNALLKPKLNRRKNPIQKDRIPHIVKQSSQFLNENENEEIKVSIYITMIQFCMSYTL